MYVSIELVVQVIQRSRYKAEYHEFHVKNNDSINYNMCLPVLCFYVYKHIKLIKRIMPMHEVKLNNVEFWSWS